jgi:hypothetical protein
MLVALAPVFLFAVALAIVVASMIRRSTLRGLASLSEDVELAASGRLSQVSDPMGVKPLKDLAETVNYVLIRLQAAERGDSRQPRAEGGTVREVIESSTVSRETRQPTAAPPAPARQLPRETHLVANASYRVTEAGPECAGILGVGPDTLIGQHLLDAIPDPRIVDAALKCLGTLPASGEERATASLEGKGYRVEVIVSRTGREQPMRIVFRPVEAA